MNTLLTTVIAIAHLVSAAVGYNPQPAQAPAQAPEQARLGAAPSPIAGSVYTLAGGGVSPSATSVTLSSLTIKQTGQPIVTSDLRQGASDKFYVTLEPGSNSRQEIVGCSGVTQNAGGTATLTGCSRGLSPIYPYAASTTLAFTHGGGTQAVFGDAPQLFNDFKSYVDSAVVSGAVDSSLSAKGIVEKASAAEAASNAQVGSGDTTAPLALTSDIASSTWSANQRVVVTKSTGYIDNSLIATSSAKDATNPLFNNVTLTGTTTTATSTSYFTNGIPYLGIGKNFIVVSTTGTSSLSIPSGLGRALVIVCAGGGTNPADSSNVISATGGAGGCGIKQVDLTGTSSVTSFVGAAGQWSTFGVNGFYMSCTPGGTPAGGGGQDGGAGGTCTGADVNIAGAKGSGSISVTGLTQGGDLSNAASYFGGGTWGAGTNQGVLILNY